MDKTQLVTVLTTGAALDFDITFNTGAAATLTVHVVNGYIPSDNANLSNLSVNGTPVNGFAPDVTAYDVELPYGASIATVTATTGDPNAGYIVTPAPSLPGRATVTVTAEDGTTTKTYTINFTVGAPPAATLVSIAITTPATKLVYAAGESLDIGGMVVTGTYSDNTTKTESVTTANVSGFDSTTPAEIQLLTVTVGGKTTTYTVKINAAPSNHTSVPSISGTIPYTAGVKTGDGNGTPIPVTVNKDSRSAYIDAGSQKLTSGHTVITAPSIPDVDTYSVGISVPELSTSDAQGALTLNTDSGSVTVPSNMLTGISGIGGSKAAISIGEGDKSSLPEDVKAAIGDRPLVQLTLSINGKRTDWSNANAPVAVSIPYAPDADELANPESIVTCRQPRGWEYRAA